jgi:hypothetical protein
MQNLRGPQLLELDSFEHIKFLVQSGAMNGL